MMESLDAAYFDRIYAESGDPWDFTASEYEREKYASTIALLSAQNYGRAFEIGCSIGVLTGMLAAICSELLAVDINEKALASARRRNTNARNIDFARMAIPAQFPDGRFDLIVVSEVAYYWSDADLARARDLIAAAAAGGTVELVHFLPKVDDYVRDGDAVHGFFLADSRYRRIASKRSDRYRIDVCTIAPA